MQSSNPAPQTDVKIATYCNQLELVNFLKTLLLAHDEIEAVSSEFWKLYRESPPSWILPNPTITDAILKHAPQTAVKIAPHYNELDL